MTMVRFQLAVLALEVGSVHACKKENEQEQKQYKKGQLDRGSPMSPTTSSRDKSGPGMVHDGSDA